MAVMSLTTPQIAHYYSLADGSVKAYVKLMLLESLGPQQRQVYDIVKRLGGCRVAEVAGEMGIKVNHAGNLMKALVEFGLLKRRPVVDEEGLYYWYEVAE